MRALLALVLAFAAAAAAAEVRVRVVETDPPAEAALGRFEPFYVRIQFDADEPVSLWVRPYRHGKPVDRGARTNPSPKYTGSGYALGWVEFTAATEVDEIRIRAGGGTPYREREVASHPVKLAWTGQAPAARAHEAWVGELKQQAEVAFKQAQREQASRPASAGDTVLVSGFMLVMLGLAVGGVGAPAWALWKWRGAWRVAAAFPALIMAFVVLRIVVDTARDPTSHNLWPFEVLMWGGGSVGIVAALGLARRVFGATDVGK